MGVSVFPDLYQQEAGRGPVKMLGGASFHTFLQTYAKKVRNLIKTGSQIVCGWVPISQRVSNKRGGGGVRHQTIESTTLFPRRSLRLVFESKNSVFVCSQFVYLHFRDWFPISAGISLSGSLFVLFVLFVGIVGIKDSCKCRVLIKFRYFRTIGKKSVFFVSLVF